MDVEALTHDSCHRKREDKCAKYREYYIHALDGETNPTDNVGDGENTIEEDMAEEVDERVKPRVTLETQKDCPHLKGIIDFLQDGILPEKDREKARSIVCQAEFFVIQDDALYRLTPLRGKRRTEMTAAWPRLCIPKAEREIVLSTYHSLSHHGQIKMYETLRQKFYWAGLSTDIKLYIEQCEICQQIRNSDGRPQTLLTAIDPPSCPFERISVDHHKISEGRNKRQPFKYVMAIIDTYSRECVLVPTKTTNAAEAAEGMYNSWLSRFGFPKTIIADRAKIWFSTLWQSLMNFGYTRRSFTSARRPQSNGRCEAFFKNVVRHIRAYCDGVDDWPKLIPSIEMAHRCTIQSDLGVSPFRCLYGFDMRLQLDNDLVGHRTTGASQLTVEHLGPQIEVLRSILSKNLQDSKERMEAVANKLRRPHQYRIGDRVWLINDYYNERQSSGLNHKHEKAFLGPFLIVDQNGPLCKIMQLYSGKFLKPWYNVDKLRQLKDTSRDILYNRCRPNTRTNQDATANSADTDMARQTDDVNSISPITSMNLVGEVEGQTKSPLHSKDGEQTSQATSEPFQNRIIRIAAKRIAKPVAFYKTFFENVLEPIWVPADKLPVQLLIDFNVKRYQNRVQPLSARQLNRLVKS
jgi:transposase InsO family protein